MEKIIMFVKAREVFASDAGNTIRVESVLTRNANSRQDIVSVVTVAPKGGKLFKVPGTERELFADSLRRWYTKV